VSRKPPSLESLLNKTPRDKPVAFVLAGHNGSGKSTLWRERLSDALRIPLINADRMMLSILPEPDTTGVIPEWARSLRDGEVRWQKLAQEGVRAFKRLVMEHKLSFAFETVFSHWRARADGSMESKIDDIKEMQREGYFVVLLFVGLTSSDVSIGRVYTRRQQGGHDVDVSKLVSRFPRTQAAVAAAATVADMAVMFDNSRVEAHAFTLVRAQMRKVVMFDARDPRYSAEVSLRNACDPWLENVVGPFKPGQSSK
jgi:predicted ABC-type ATPase